MKHKKRKTEESSMVVWTASNMVSMLRLLMALPLALLLLEPGRNMHWILVLGALAYASDLLDGWLARHFASESSFGRIIDPLADKVFITVAVVMMIVSNIVPLWFGIVIIARDIIILAGGLHLKRRSGILVQSTMLGKAAVVSIGVVLVTALVTEGRHVLLTLSLLLSLGLIVASLYTYAERYWKLLRSAQSS
jgi:cardiolipin synthase (CMP-forming)